MEKGPLAWRATSRQVPTWCGVAWPLYNLHPPSLVIASANLNAIISMVVTPASLAGDVAERVWEEREVFVLGPAGVGGAQRVGALFREVVRAQSH